MRDDTDTASGKKQLIAVIAIVIGVGIVVSVLHTVIIGPQKLLAHIARLCITVTLCYCLYQGHAWARWLSVGLFGLGGALSLLSGIRRPSAFMLLMGTAYLICVLILTFSQSLSAFLQEQRARRQGDSSG